MEYKHKCIKCGNCCRAGFDIYIRKEDILNWIENDKESFVKNIQIDPKCISIKGLGGFHIEVENEDNTLGKDFQNFSEKEKKKLIEFILNNHDLLGNDDLPLPIYTFLPNIGPKPILSPKTIQIMINGLKRGLLYILNFNYGQCPYLKNNTCSIYKFRPKECRDFPFNNKGELTLDVHLLKLCKGIDKVS